MTMSPGHRAAGPARCSQPIWWRKCRRDDVSRVLAISMGSNVLAGQWTGFGRYPTGPRTAVSRQL